MSGTKSNNQARAVVLISGRGSNLESLIKNASSYSIDAVISNTALAGGLKIACDNNIQTYVFERSNFHKLTDQKQAIYECVDQIKPDLLILAGFMQIIEPEFVKKWYGRLLNIHPSLLPELTGLDTHKRALELKLNTHGCTVHYLDTGVDTGPIIAHAKVSVEPDDTEETLANRVLNKEHVIYPWVVNLVAQGEIRLENRSVVFSKVALDEVKRLNFHIPTIS